MARVITMGEIMLRLSAPGYQKIIQSDSFDVSFGGAEANVAVSLANYGHEACFVTKIPDNPIGESAVVALRKHGVNCDFVVRGGDRLGIYYVEAGASMRASNVIYDRRHSSIAEADTSDFDFDKIFDGADWFHITGITPAISDQAAQLTEEALKEAKRKNISVSIDLNYRQKLWSQEKARRIMTRLMQYVDVCIGNEEDAEKTLGFQPGNTDIKRGALELSGYRDVLRRMTEQFHLKYVASSLRESCSASDNEWSACIYNGKDFYHSRKYSIRIVDRVGSGDAFAAGLICGLLERKPMEDALEYAVAASALKHTLPGDFNLVTRTEVETLLKGDASGRVQR